MTTAPKIPASVAQASVGTSSVRSIMRAELLAQRKLYPTRTVLDAALCANLLAELNAREARCVAFYWPIHGEVDLRPVITNWLAEHPNCQAALPLVVQAHAPLSFYRWRPESNMSMGAFGIAVPLNEPIVQPDVCILPCVGFSQELDGRLFRLGYGGGYYDRTLASCSLQNKLPQTIGVAHHFAQQASLTPQAHDWEMDVVVTDKQILRRGSIAT